MPQVCGSIDCMLKVREWIGTSRRLHLIGDGGFPNAELIDYNKSLGVVQTGRLRLDAALYDSPVAAPAAEGQKKKPGPKPQKGKRQVNLAQRLADPNTLWTSIDVAWYGGQKKAVEILTDVSLWHVAGNAPISLRWVLVRPTSDTNDKDKDKGKDKDTHSSRRGAAFFSTDVNATAEKIIACYAERWNIEVFFEEVRSCLGFETQRGWSNRTIGRTTPCLFGVFSLAVVLAKQLYPTALPIRQAGWYTKEEATFRDVLCAVREHILRPNAPAEAPTNTIGSCKIDDLCTIPRSLLTALQDIACYAA